MLAATVYEECAPRKGEISAVDDALIVNNSKVLKASVALHNSYSTYLPYVYHLSGS